MARPDVVVLGLGPAGRALAGRLAAQGARVLAVDPRPERRWHQTYGGWLHQLPGWLPPEVVGAIAPRTELRGHGRHRLLDSYLVLDTAALQQALRLDGVEVRSGAVDLAGAAALAPVVVDARGSWPVGEGRAPASVPVQTAHGVALEPDDAACVLAGADAVLMDWRPYHGGAGWGSEPASFCYVIPLPDGRVLAEETCLAGAPPLTPDLLQARLSERLARHGVDPAAVAAAPSERVWIPLLAAARPAGTNRFGAGGHQLNPVSGYSVMASLRSADAAARSLLQHGKLPRTPRGTRALRVTALRAVTRLGGDQTMELFDAFGRLGAERQTDVLDPAADAPRLLAALGSQAGRMRPHHFPGLVRATAGGLTPGASTDHDQPRGR